MSHRDDYEAHFTLFHRGDVVGSKQIAGWKGGYPPRFGITTDTGRTGQVECELTKKAKDGDIIVCKYSVATTLNVTYWHRVAGVFHETTKGHAQIIAQLKFAKSIKGDPSGQFYVRVPGSTGGMRDANDESGKRRLFASRQKARQWCRNAAPKHDGDLKIVHPGGGVEVFVWDGAGGSPLASVRRMKDRSMSLKVTGSGHTLEQL